MARSLLLSLVVLVAAACGGASSEGPEAGSPTDEGPATERAATTSEDAPPATTRKQESKPARKAPLPGLPRFTAGYRGWTKLNSKPLPPRESDPHSGTKNIYVSKEATRDEYPVGTVVVKEAFRPGKASSA